MGRCETCGNEYENAFGVVMNHRTHIFDCFECAIQALAPACTHCGCTIIGHGVEVGGQLFCCGHCARHADSAVGEREPAMARQQEEVGAD